MAKNISLLGADYPDVPAVVLPKTGGGSATFVDADDIGNVEEALAIVVNGDTAPKAITAGQYLFIKNHSTLATGGYHATAAISSGGTVSGSNVSADADGIANALDGRLANVEDVTSLFTPTANVVANDSNTVYTAQRLGRFVVLNFQLRIASELSGTRVFTLPDSLRPSTITRSICARTSTSAIIKYCGVERSSNVNDVYINGLSDCAGQLMCGCIIYLLYTNPVGNLT